MPATHSPSHLLRPGCWFALAAAVWLPASALAGQPLAESKSVLESKVVATAEKPLCFFGETLCFEVEARARFEARENNFDFDNSLDNPTDDAWLLQRFRLGVAWQPTPWLKFYAQGQDAREYHSDRPDVPGVLGAEGDDTFDLRQAYVLLGDARAFPLTLQLGRQILSYGDERLVGPLDWSNFGRTFDAARLRWAEAKWSLEVFSGSPVLITRSQYNQSDLFNGNETHRELVFSGLYFSTSALPATTLDLYAFSLNQRNGNDTNLEGNLTLPRAGAAPQQNGDPTARSDFFTLGLRVKGDPKQLGGFEYDGEFAAQTGRVQGLDLSAAAVHAGLGYTFQSLWAQPRIYAEYNFATGDQDPTDGQNNTFQNLFPTNHKFYGFMDLFSWQNLHDPAISFSATPFKNFTVRVDGHAFFVASNEDASYRANGLIRNRPIAREADSYLGSELDVVVRYKPWAHLALEAGYSHFIAGDYFLATGRSDDADFGYVMATLAF